MKRSFLLPAAACQNIYLEFMPALLLRVNNLVVHAELSLRATKLGKNNALEETAPRGFIVNPSEI